MPRAVLEELHIRPEMVQRFIAADGQALERPVGIGIVHAAGTKAPDYVVFAEPGDTIILGARSLQGIFAYSRNSTWSRPPASPWSRP